MGRASSLEDTEGYGLGQGPQRRTGYPLPREAPPPPPLGSFLIADFFIEKKKNIFMKRRSSELLLHRSLPPSPPHPALACSQPQLSTARTLLPHPCKLGARRTRETRTLLAAGLACREAEGRKQRKGTEQELGQGLPPLERQMRLASSSREVLPPSYQNDLLTGLGEQSREAHIDGVGNAIPHLRGRGRSRFEDNVT